MTSRKLVDQLLQHRSDFLRFLERRVGNAATAEDLLQEALLRSVDRVSEVREEGALVGWFYRVLENAVIDHHRRSATSARTLGEVGRELADEVVKTDDAPARTCKCVTKLKSELKPDYAHALERIEVDEVPVKDFADEEGLTRSNAAVRVFRARQALRQKVEATCGHCAKAGCTDCTCVS